MSSYTWSTLNVMFGFLCMACDVLIPVKASKCFLFFYTQFSFSNVAAVYIHTSYLYVCTLLLCQLFMSYAF